VDFLLTQQGSPRWHGCARRAVQNGLRQLKRITTFKILRYDAKAPDAKPCFAAYRINIEAGQPHLFNEAQFPSLPTGKINKLELRKQFTAHVLPDT